MIDSDQFLAKLPSALEKTGFLLENEVTEAFSKAKWSVINNRYYVDDVDGKARELDLIAYKLIQGKEVDVVTTLLISCKKDKEHAWVFMTTNKSKFDPNIDWNPQHCWASDGLLACYIENCDWKKQYINGDTVLLDKIFNVDRQCFATQLVSQESITPKNDKPICDSIAGLMKALDHEIASLPSRVKKDRIYIFNLVTVLDAKLIDAQYSGNNVSSKEVSEFKYLARYIVRKRELTARIHIVRKSQIRELVDVYSKLAEYNYHYFNDAVVKSYEAVKKVDKIREYFAKALSEELSWLINVSLRKNKQREIDDRIDLTFDNSKNELVILIPTIESSVQFLKQDISLNKSIKNALKNIVRYIGEYRIEEEIPF